MSIIDEIKGLNADEARNYLHVNGYDDGDINIVMKDWELAQRTAPVAKVVLESRPTPAPRPSSPHIEHDEDE